MSELITKIYDSDLEVSEGKREVIATISTDAVDRDGEVVQPKGMRRKNYQGNSIVMVNHDYTSLPIGKALWIKPGDTSVVAKYYVSDKTELSRDVFGLLQDGILKAHSIGFQSLRASAPSTAEKNSRPELKNASKIHREWELYELSVVGVPANPEALTLAVSKGYSQTTLDLISGKAAATAQATAEVIAAVQDAPELKKHAMTEKELMKLLSKKLETITVSIDPDKVMSAAIKFLGK